MKKRMLSLLLALVMILGLLPTVALGASVVEDRRGYASLIVENTTFTDASAASNNQPPAWKGQKITAGFPVTEGMTMMDAIVKILKERNVSQTGAENGYISEIGGLKEFDNGQDSGWMGTLNGWFTNKGFQNYVIKPGDEIRIMYTSTGRGADLGGDWGSSDKRLKALDISDDGDYLTMFPAFSPDVHEYVIPLHADLDGTAVCRAHVVPTAMNKQYQVHAYVGDEEILPSDTLFIANGMDIQITCGDPSWETACDNTPAAQTYTVHIVRPGTLLNAESVSVKTIKGNPSLEGAPVSLKFDAQRSKITGSLAPYAQTPDFNDEGFTMTLSGLPEGATARIADVYGNTISKFVGGTASVTSGLSAAGDYTYLVGVTKDSVEEFYTLLLTKPVYRLTKLKLSGFPDDYNTANVFQGQPEGTLFQADENGDSTGVVGFDGRKCWSYALYVSPAIKQVGLASTWDVNMSGAFADEFTLGVNVNGKEYVAQQEKEDAQAEFLSKPVTLNPDETTVIEFVAKQKTDPRFVLSTKVYVHVVKTPVAELVAALDALDLDRLIYPDDTALIQAYQSTYDNYTDEERAQIPAATAKKLTDASARMKLLQDRFNAGVQEMTDLVNACVPVTVDNYRDYLDTVRKATDKFLSLSDAQRAQLYKVKCASRKNVTMGFWTAYNRAILQSIADGVSTGYPTDYPDDFIIQSGYYNLDLGHEDTYYQTGFREIWTNRPNTYYNYGEKGLPFTSPGLLEFDIKDKSIFEIKEVVSVYQDLGLGGKGEHPNMLYYLVPKKAGTTTFTVKLRHENGVMYCQTPEIVVHVNSPEESKTEKLYQKLTDFTEREYTRRYDNWCYEYGQAGAEFTFHINGENGKVWVYDYLKYNEDGTAVKTAYTPDANGDVTILLKDGYNCIEVNADYEGENVTQVYALQGKVVKFITENVSRPGEALRKGDEAGVWTLGRPICLHKISRIYNNGNGATMYITDMPRQGLVRSDESIKINYNPSKFNGAAEAGWFYRSLVSLTDSGKITLHDGYIMHAGYGSGLGSELTQGNTGGMADSTTFEFGHLADITLDVADNPKYVEPTNTLASVASNGGVVKAGESITITVPDLPTGEMLKTYEVDKTQELKYAISRFYTNIPGLRSVETPFRKLNQDGTSVQSVHEIKSITFTVPADTKPGTYSIHGGNVAICYTKGYMDSYDFLYRGQIDDLTITVLPGAQKEVMDLIDAIGPVTKDSGAAIKAARDAYNELTDAQKKLVTNYDKLTAAEARWSELNPIPAGQPAQLPQNPNAGETLPFTDVNANSWYYSGVKYAYENGLMNGTGTGTFSPNADTTRGMIVTMLARLEGVSTSGTPWYAAGQKWAMDAGISDGTNMTGAITREQLAAILFRYAKQKGYDVSKSADLNGFADADAVSGYATDAMRWAVASGLIQGSNSKLNPKGTATRAQVATILMRFMQKFAK